MSGNQKKHPVSDSWPKLGRLVPWQFLGIGKPELSRFGTLTPLTVQWLSEYQTPEIRIPPKSKLTSVRISALSWTIFIFFIKQPSFVQILGEKKLSGNWTKVSCPKSKLFWFWTFTVFRRLNKNLSQLLVYLESIIGMLEMTCSSSSTVVSIAKTALRSGSSKQGKQVRASVAANIVAAPNRTSPFLSVNGDEKKPWTKNGNSFWNELNDNNKGHS